MRSAYSNAYLFLLVVVISRTPTATFAEEKRLCQQKQLNGNFAAQPSPIIPEREPGALSQTTATRPVAAWRPKLNGRVQIPGGLGIVVEVCADMYLIELEKQIARIRINRRWSLLPVA